MRPRVILLAVLLSRLISPVCAIADETPGATKDDYLWWQEARFGVFIHWNTFNLMEVIGDGCWLRADRPKGGPSRYDKSYREPDAPVPDEVFNSGYEKYNRTWGKIPVATYDNLYRVFNPIGFDADHWAKTFKEAGAGYVALTAKHWDGFCMFDSKYTDYDIMSSPFRRDVCKELADACHKVGLKIMWYYCVSDLYEPSFDKSNFAGYNDFLCGQIEELLTNYGEVSGLWWDVGAKEVDTDRLYRIIRRCQPKCIYNNRMPNSPEIYFMSHEQRIGAFDTDHPWETCATLQGDVWFWNGGINIKSENTCLRMLIQAAGGDGNFLLDFGPDPKGRIFQLSEERYLGMGRWLKQYGNSIYRTRGGPYKPGIWGFSTRSNRTIYLHLLQQSTSSTFRLPALPAKVLSARTFAGEEIPVKQTDDALVLSLSPDQRQTPDTIVALTIDKDAMDIAAIASRQAVTLTLDCDVTASSSRNPKQASGSPHSVVLHRWEKDVTTYAGEIVGREEPREQMVFTDLTEHEKEIQASVKMSRGHVWRYWQAKADDKQPWIEIDLGQNRSIRAFTLDEHFDRVRGFEFQILAGGDWKTVHQGMEIGFQYSVALEEPVSTDAVRLVITETTGEQPLIREIDVYSESRYE